MRDVGDPCRDGGVVVAGVWLCCRRKVVVLGRRRCGKSALVQRLLLNSYGSVKAVPTADSGEGLPVAAAGAAAGASTDDVGASQPSSTAAGPQLTSKLFHSSRTGAMTALNVRRRSTRAARAGGHQAPGAACVFQATHHS